MRAPVTGERRGNLPQRQGHRVYKRIDLESGDEERLEVLEHLCEEVPEQAAVRSQVPRPKAAGRTAMVIRYSRPETITPNIPVLRQEAIGTERCQSKQSHLIHTKWLW